MKIGISMSLAVLIMALIGFATQAQAEYPKSKDLYVNDFANLLTASDAITIRTAIAKLKDDTGVQAVVVTIRSIRDYKTGDQTIESFATNLFNKWGIGDREKNDGVLILVAVKDRKVRIELGSGYGKSYNEQMQSVINQRMLPNFRTDNYSLGIVEGTDSVVHILSERASTISAQSAQTPNIKYDSNSSTSDSGPNLLFFVFLGGLIVTIFGLIWYGRFRKRRCPSCRVALGRLYGSAEDQYLDDGQKLEKSLGSVDYQVWQCPKCGFHDLQAKYHWLSSFAGCHSCGYRTMKVGELITVHPTEFSSGEKQIDKNCYRCGFRRCETDILPMLPRHTRSGYGHSHHSASGSDDTLSRATYASSYDSASSSYDSGSSSYDSGSSSSGSYDGGSSSGDGASGSW